MVLDLGQNNISEEILIDDEDNGFLLSKYHFIFSRWHKINSYDNYNGSNFEKFVKFNNDISDFQFFD